MLKSQLQSAGIKTVDEVVTLDQAQANLKTALEQLMAGDETAEEDFDKWSAVVENHPEQKERNEAAA